MNICTNAFHALEIKGGTLHLSFAYIAPTEQALACIPHLHPNRFVRLSISDTGQDISPEVRESIFEPYFITKTKGKGTGIGLAICEYSFSSCCTLCWQECDRCDNDGNAR